MNEILGLFFLITSVIAAIFVFRDAYFKHRYNLEASILWVLLVLFTPITLGLPLYLIFRPNRDIRQENAVPEPNDQFLRNKYKVLNIIVVAVYSILLVVIAFFLFKIIPTFAELYKGFNIQLPLLTQILITISQFLRSYSLITIPLIILSVVFLFKKCLSILQKSFPISYVIAIIINSILIGVVIGIMVVGMFLPIFKIAK